MDDPVAAAAGLRLEERLVHSHWKVRSEAIDELTKTYEGALDDKDEIFRSTGTASLLHRDYPFPFGGFSWSPQLPPNVFI